jgi:hypothetical protein
VRRSNLCFKTRATQWLQSPLVANIGYPVFATIVALILIRALQTLASRSIKDTSARYRVRKFIAFFGYVVLALLLLAVFSARMAQFTVIFGVAGAGIAFALQEVIASIAGCIAISFGGFHRPGDRVQVGGISGDVIDIGMLRATLMEICDWVKGERRKPTRSRLGVRPSSWSGCRLSPWCARVLTDAWSDGGRRRRAADCLWGCGVVRQHAQAGLRQTRVQFDDIALCCAFAGPA